MLRIDSTTIDTFIHTDTINDNDNGKKGKDNDDNGNDLTFPHVKALLLSYSLYCISQPALSALLPTVHDYIKKTRHHLINTDSTLLLALGQTPSTERPVESYEKGEVIGYALYRYVKDTFSVYRCFVEELFVRPECRRKGVGTALYQVIEKEAMEKGCYYVSADVVHERQEAQPFLMKQKGWFISAHAFSLCVDHPNLLATCARVPRALSCIRIDSSSLSAPHIQKLINLAEVTYRQLRTHENSPFGSAFGSSKQEYVQRLTEVLTEKGTCLLLAYETSSHDATEQVLGIAMLRILQTFSCVRMHVDDLATEASVRSTGVGAFLIQQIRRLATNAAVELITLESGCQRWAAHSFYWREGFLTTAHFWRKQIETGKGKTSKSSSI